MRAREKTRNSTLGSFRAETLDQAFCPQVIVRFVLADVRFQLHQPRLDRFLKLEITVDVEALRALVDRGKIAR